MYGGSISFLVGSYSMAFGFDASQTQASFSIYNGDINLISSGITISNNFISQSTALSSVGSGSSYSSTMYGGMSYGGGISLLIGGYAFVGSLSAYFISESINVINGETTVQSSRVVVFGKTLVACAAKTEVVGNGVAYAGSAQGGGISLLVGSFAYTISLSGSAGLTVSEIHGGILISYCTWLLDNNMVMDCVASTVVSQASNIVTFFSPSDSFGTNAYVAQLVLFLCQICPIITQNLQEWWRYRCAVCELRVQHSHQQRRIFGHNR